jgi:hypothetical protein
MSAQSWGVRCCARSAAMRGDRSRTLRRLFHARYLCAYIGSTVRSQVTRDVSRRSTALAVIRRQQRSHSTGRGASTAVALSPESIPVRKSISNPSTPA